MNYNRTEFVRVLTLQEVPEVRKTLHAQGIKHRIIYQGPRPLCDYSPWSTNPAFTLKKNANRARLYYIKTV
jgi:hypothetical protein